MRLHLALFASILLVTFTKPIESVSNRSFRVNYQNNRFEKDGQPFRFVSGQIDYFRALPQRWRRIFRTMRAAGLNAVATYIEWATNNPHEGQYVWTGMADIEAFIRLAAEEGLLVIIRTGPYICAERSGGGFPYWLLTKHPNIEFRTTDKDYLQEVSTWYSKLMPRLQPYLYGNGGPIIMVQLENEYGAYGCSRDYREWLRNETKKYVGDKAVLFTTDQSNDGSVKCGKTDWVLATVDFFPGSNSDIDSTWKILRNYQRDGPLLNTEFYTDRNVRWNDRSISKPDPNGDFKNSLRYMLNGGASVNLYMWFAGTNYGFTSGTQVASPYKMIMTSYLYYSPLDEAGDVTPIVSIVRDVMKEFFPMPNITLPEKAPKMQPPPIQLRPVTTLFSFWSRSLLGNQPIQSKQPRTFEQLNQGGGFVLYETMFDGSSSLKIPKPYDRAYIYVNGTVVGLITRDNSSNSVQITTDHGRKLQILLESVGRSNYDGLNEPKGIVGDVNMDKRSGDWTITGFPFGNISKLYEVMQRLRYVQQEPEVKNQIENRSSDNLSNGPIIFEGTFDLSDNQIYDTWIDTSGWGKGFIVVNGLNLGRYWPLAGPQITLYLPKEFLVMRGNSVIVVEFLKAPRNNQIKFSNKAIYKVV